MCCCRRCGNRPTAQVSTVRERLLKLAVWLERSVRRIVLHPAQFGALGHDLATSGRGRGSRLTTRPEVCRQWRRELRGETCGVKLPLRTCDDHRITLNRERSALPPPSASATVAEEPSAYLA